MFIDISVPIRTGMVVYEGDPGVDVIRTQSMADGANCNVSKIDFGLHTGTHIDAPVHFIEGGSGADVAPLDVLIGPCTVVDATALDGDIDAAAIAANVPAGTERVLFKTRNSALWAANPFTRDFIALTANAAETLVRAGVRLVGVDYLSVAPAADPAPTHIELLRADVVILEGLDLRGVEPGAYDLICLPLRIVDADGAPARAVLVRD